MEAVLGGRAGPCSKQAIRSNLVKGGLVRCHEVEWEFGLVDLGIWGGFVGTVGVCLGSVRGFGVAGHFGGSGG